MTAQVVIQQSDTQEDDSSSSDKFLVAEDNVVLQKLAKVNLTQFGATVEVCQNREEALQPVRNGFKDQTKHDVDNELFRSNKEKKEEKYYEIHIKIIALTAHVSGEEANNTILAGYEHPDSENLQNGRLISDKICNIDANEIKIKKYVP
ncbi:hypothetical protein QYF36_003898 [Acer negundo]|nr:hypothetical protein QYF36_003898 [Acer negundo]